MPSRGLASLRFVLPTGGRLDAAIYAASGRLIWRLADGIFEPGTQLLTWDGRTHAAGSAGPGVCFARGSFTGHGQAVTRDGAGGAGPYGPRRLSFCASHEPISGEIEFRRRLSCTLLGL